MNADPNHTTNKIFQRLDRLEIHLSAIIQLLEITEKRLTEKETELKKLKSLRNFSIN